MRDLFAGADPAYRISVRFVSAQRVAHAVRAQHVPAPLRRRISRPSHPHCQVLHAPELQADPASHGTRSGTFIVLNFARRIDPDRRHALRRRDEEVDLHGPELSAARSRACCSMHCSANIGDAGDVALFFGLSGTGKTTLSADPERGLIGDDEHGWSDHGVFNFEGGCYAKVIKLSAEGEPEIYATTQMFGTVLENVVLDPASRAMDFDSDRRSPRTLARPIRSTTFPNHVAERHAAAIRKNIVFLTADAFGVLPPIARLTPRAGDVPLPLRLHGQGGRAPSAASPSRRRRSAPASARRSCRGIPARTPRCSARRSRSTTSSCWLVNTGWTGGPFGVGQRMKPGPHARHGARRAAPASSIVCPQFRIRCSGWPCPTEVPGVPAEVLLPRRTWTDPRRTTRRPATRRAVPRQLRAVRRTRCRTPVRAAGPPGPKA